MQKKCKYCRYWLIDFQGMGEEKGECWHDEQTLIKILEESKDNIYEVKIFTLADGTCKNFKENS